ncbi:hypothetical protein DFA_10147 [Cavenderia fasciculata]|uniref:Uncharacterized protein n=1 Tax=Cavenderia fasciculata TaxID=261658 RepID=F4Q9E4_CACFS|nr:uncharacterized protein DFA_10147 [Cavenderia fasciculata]EGG15313.1 hypothetical protein DFA_10147 [Cavenderia fasciculata]|eukprot:XP_004352033.1 hypothetical protein DFA_10147 [Cavenderia fasciculata]
MMMFSNQQPIISTSVASNNIIIPSKNSNTIINNNNKNNNLNLNLNRFILREFKSEQDMEAITTIPRLPQSYNFNLLEGMSHPIDYSIRPSLTKFSKVVVAEDRDRRQTIGAYACNIKDVINNVPITKATSNFEMYPQYDQCQMAWKLDHQVRVIPLNSNTYLQAPRVTKIYHNQEIKERWTNAFQQYNFIPSDFGHILQDNEKYLESTYVATATTVDGYLYEASISVWNQDLIFTLKNRLQQVQRHRQLFCCYSIGQDKEQSDTLFQFLLQHVHNELYSQGINYVFAGFSMTDPIRCHFPLLPGIKTLEFTSIGRFSTTSELNQFKSQSQLPIWNDPRDYGILMLYPETNINNNISKL